MSDNYLFDEDNKAAADRERERSLRIDERRKEYEKYLNGLKRKGLYREAGEIDRCLKKVSEGVETFEDIWQKVHNATNTNQKEKYETDLKKEIKKLQRLRDQIKSWIASGEIKDKSTLVDTRKLIETQMERFKVVERETKTKAYSKEGLGAAQKVDPTTREREDLNNWLVSSIDQIQIQMDQFECEVESITAAKKKKLDKDKQERLDELKAAVERHRFHMGKLETILRMLDNLSIDVNALRKFLSQVKKIKDDIEYYLESNQEPEFEENEFLYDDIEGLEEFDEGIAQQSALTNLALNSTEDGELVETPTSITSGNNSQLNSPPVSPIHSRDSSSDPEKRRKSSDDSSKVVRPVAMKAIHSPSPGSKAVGVVGTPPKNVATPNNSSPSSGLSNHVSSLSSLSSSPTQTQNYHNALNNAKTLSHMDCVEHNNTSSTTSGGIATGDASKSPLTKGSSTANSTITNVTDGASISTANGLISENGETSGDHSSPHQLNSSENLTGSAGVVGENGLISSLSQDGSSAGVIGVNSQLLSAAVGSGSSSITNNTDLTHHQPFTDSTSSLETNSQQLTNHSTPFSQQPAFGVFGTPGVVGASGLVAAGMSNSLSAFAANVSCVSSMGIVNNVNGGSSLLSGTNINSSSSSSNSSNSSVVLGGSSNVIGLTSMINHNISGGVNSGASVTSLSSSNSPLIMTTTTTTATSPPQGNMTPGAVTNSSRESVSLIGANTGVQSSSHSNSSTNNLLSQQQQQLQQLQMQGSSSQTGNSRDTTPITDYMRQQDQMLLTRILHEGGDAMASLKTMAQDVLDRTGLNLGDSSVSENKTQEANIPPLLGVAPLGPVPLSKEHQYQFQMLDAAHYHMPVSADAERMRQFLPRNPIPTPPYYPQHPMANADSLEFFQRLSIETLFFIFYYLEGTKAQYMAAKVLKKQSWRFHTKYMMWFQRHEEPKVINEEFEQGTYIYFDIEKWSQRKKDGFVFEYRYLEDRDLS